MLFLLYQSKIIYLVSLTYCNMKSVIDNAGFNSTIKIINTNTKIVFTLYGEVLNIKCYFDAYLSG